MGIIRLLTTVQLEQRNCLTTMIATGLLFLCAVAATQAFLLPGPIIPGPLIPIPLPVKPIIKHIPIVKTIRQPVYIRREIRIPHYIERPVPVPYPIGGGGGSSGSAGAIGGAGLDFGLNAKIEDADTVNIQAGVSGVAGGALFSGNNNNGFDDGFNNNDGGFGRRIGGRGGILRRQQPQRISVSQTSFSAPSARISQPKIDHGHGHGISKVLPPKHF